MQPIAFCNRCRGMKIGWNKRYVFHALRCHSLAGMTSKLLIFSVVVLLVGLEFPALTGVLFSGISTPDQVSIVEAGFIPPAFVPPVQQKPPVGPVESISDMLEKNGVEAALRDRVARAIVASGLKYQVDPRLIASIMIVESRANPFAVSESNSVGIMQIHLPTWGSLADKQGINLFKVEDNADLGVRILSGYISVHGVWGGVAQYKGRTEAPESQRAADEYVEKVQKIYGPIPHPSVLAEPVALQ